MSTNTKMSETPSSAPEDKRIHDPEVAEEFAYKVKDEIDPIVDEGARMVGKYDELIDGNSQITRDIEHAIGLHFDKESEQRRQERLEELDQKSINRLEYMARYLVSEVFGKDEVKAQEAAKRQAAIDEFTGPFRESEELYRSMKSDERENTKQEINRVIDDNEHLLPEIEADIESERQGELNRQQEEREKAERLEQAAKIAAWAKVEGSTSISFRELEDQDEETQSSLKAKLKKVIGDKLSDTDIEKMIKDEELRDFVISEEVEEKRSKSESIGEEAKLVEIRDGSVKRTLLQKLTGRYPKRWRGIPMSETFDYETDEPWSFGEVEGKTKSGAKKTEKDDEKAVKITFATANALEALGFTEDWTHKENPEDFSVDGKETVHMYQIYLPESIAEAVEKLAKSDPFIYRKLYEVIEEGNQSFSEGWDKESKPTKVRK